MMYQARYLQYINNYLFRCYQTFVLDAELFLVENSCRKQIRFSECAEFVYTLRVLRHER